MCWKRTGKTPGSQNRGFVFCIVSNTCFRQVFLGSCRHQGSGMRQLWLEPEVSEGDL